MSGNYFYLDGECSSVYGVKATSQNPYACPVRNREERRVFNNDIPFMEDNGYFESITRNFDIFVIDNLQGQTQRMRDWLVSKFLTLKTGEYVEFGDQYNDLHYLRAYDISGLESFLHSFNRFGHGTISLLCDAYRYLRNGAKPTNLSANTTYTYTNPTEYDALPTIEITSGGGFTLDINGAKMIVPSPGRLYTYIIDCHRRAVTQEGLPVTYTITYPYTMTGETFLRFLPGVNTINSSALATLYKNWREI